MFFHFTVWCSRRSEFQEVGGEKQRVGVTRYGYESKDKLIDIDILDHSIVIDGKQLLEVVRENGDVKECKFTYYGGPQKGMVVERVKAKYWEHSGGEYLANQIRKHYCLTN